MKRKFKESQQTPPKGYETLERQMLALFYGGVYLTNRDIVEVAAKLGYTYPLKSRTMLLKQLMKQVHEEGKEMRMVAAFTQFYNARLKTYETLGRAYPAAQPIIKSWYQHARSTLMLLQREARESPYE